ncbi:MAG: chemotaxis protein CheA [Pseudomonadota bacterium]
MKRTQQESDQSFIAEAMPAFISEAREQLENIEQLLLQLEENPQDRDLLDALFRCAHTVKGSAGIFGLMQLVEFAHHVETLLDRMREGHIRLDPSLSTLLLQCNDQILHLVDIASNPSLESDEYIAERADLVCRLLAAVGNSQPVPASAGQETCVSGAAVPAGGRWHVSAEFGTECMRNGMDPLGIVRYLGTLGEVVAITCDRSSIPSLAELDPESCHLVVGIGLVTEATKEEIEGAFSFVKDDCRLRLIAPSASLEHFVTLLDEMPDHPQLGQLLVNIGAVTQAQLDAGLRQQSALRAGGDDAPRLGDVLQVSAGVAPEIVAAAVSKQQRQREAGPDDNRCIRVQADRLDVVINLLGELVIAGAGASLLARQTRHSGLTEASQHMSRLIEEIRNGTLQLRMVPIGETFSRFRRVVRDTASQLGKDVILEIEGADTELDKSVVEKIADPLMHLVRNGLDHGLETPEQRELAGKPRQGRLVLSARHESGSILIRIRDDGRGIDRSRVLKRAWERGLVDVDVTPSDADILKLIFAPGFSTAEQVTNLSGRGVGMDVVRKNIEALRGTVDVSSQLGHGTVIDIRLPLTLAIIDGFLVAVGSSKFVLPLEAVVEVIEGRDPNELLTMPDKRGGFCVPLRGELLPVVSLRQLYALQGEAPERVSIVVVRAGDRSYGIEVDMLLGQHQTVIKPLGRMFRTLRGISGSSILGNGEVALIFDVPSLGLLAAEPPRINTRGARETAFPGRSIHSSTEGQSS